MESLNVARLFFLEKLCLMVEDLPGDVVECGVGAGYSMLYLAHSLHIHQIRKFLWGFDSFQGFPEPTAEDKSPRHVQKGENKYAKAEVERLLLDHLKDELFFRSQISLIQGFFETTLPSYSGSIAMLHLDVDLYQSYKFCLQTLYPRVVPGGVIAFDEYRREGSVFPGAPKAIDEFFQDEGVNFIKDPLYGKYYVVKPTRIE